MAKIFEAISEQQQSFIEKQMLFFVGTAADGGRVNVSPKGLDSLRVLGPNRVIWLNLTGSGNETAAHLLHHNRITLMFCAFEGKPLILRLYGKATLLHEGDAEWDEHIGKFPEYLGSRQLVDVEVETVQTSCGFAVPLMEFQGEREQLIKWGEVKGREGVKEYWKEKNTKSIDGLPTDLS